MDTRITQLFIDYFYLFLDTINSDMNEERTCDAIEDACKQNNITSSLPRSTGQGEKRLGWRDSLPDRVVTAVPVHGLLIGLWVFIFILFYFYLKMVY